MRTLDSFKEKGKIALVRVDFNVPIKDGAIQDDVRIRAALPTIKFLLKQECKVVLISHLGRPKGADKQFTLKPVAEALQLLLKKPVTLIEKPVGMGAKELVEELDDKIFLLENIRFYKEEEENDKVFSKKLSEIGEIFVNDAFGTSHRAHASTEGVARYLPSYAGFLLEKEITELSKGLNPKTPLVLLIGGLKVSDKIGVLNNFISKAKYILIGGAMAFTFLKAQGYEVGKSIVEQEKIELAKELLKKAKEKIVLPIDVFTARAINKDEYASVHKIGEMPVDEIGVDIGPETVILFKDKLKEANTIIWNGSMGVNEIPQFSHGTQEIAKTLAKSKAVTIVGGGDTISVVDELGIEAKMTHVSTGGGASLEFLEGKKLPAVKILE